MTTTVERVVEWNGAEQAINACLFLVIFFLVVFITSRKIFVYFVVEIHYGIGKLTVVSLWAK